MFHILADQANESRQRHKTQVCLAEITREECICRGQRKERRTLFEQCEAADQLDKES